MATTLVDLPAFIYQERYSFFSLAESSNPENVDIFYT